MRAVLREWLREPLLHFFVLGALLFGVYGVLNRGSASAQDEIVVSRGQQQNLRMQFERVWQRAPTSAELQRLVDHWVKEEILYREGVTLGLDRDDAVVRRRIGQKLEFIVESAAPPPPTDAELQVWLDTHASQYRLKPTYSLRQVYFDPSRHRNLDAIITAAKRGLAAGNEVIGDATMLPSTLEDASVDDVQRIFGGNFAGSLAPLTVGAWQGPVASAFGVHLVAVTRRDPARDATLSEARTEAERDFVRARLQQANADFYDRLRAKYAVRIEGGEGAAADPAG